MVEKLAAKLAVSMLSSRKLVQKVAAVALGLWDNVTDKIEASVASLAPEGTPLDKALEAAGKALNEGLDASLRQVLDYLAKGKFEIPAEAAGDASRKKAILVACDVIVAQGRVALDDLNTRLDIPLVPEGLEESLEQCAGDLLEAVVAKVKWYAEEYF